MSANWMLYKNPCWKCAKRKCICHKQMNKQELEAWKQESIKQAYIRIAKETIEEAQKVIKAAGEVC